MDNLEIFILPSSNPDGSHYDDPGVRWVSYFNGGDALHQFNRASFGAPQSLGCVELPEAAGKKGLPVKPNGPLVPIEQLAAPRWPAGRVRHIGERPRGTGDTAGQGNAPLAARATCRTRRRAPQSNLSFSWRRLR